MKALLVAAVALVIPALVQADSPAPPEELASAKVIRVVTQDEDGDTRDTKIWVAVINADPYIRTGDTRWFQNLERGSSLIVIMDGKEYPALATRIQDRALIERTHAKFREKYGFQDRLVGLLGGGGKVLRLESPH